MNQAIKRGVFTGIIVALWLVTGFTVLSLVLKETPKATLRTLTGALGLIILLIGILYGIRKAKMENGPHEFTYGRAIKTGFTISVTVAVIVSLVSLLYITIVNPNFAEDMVREAADSLKKSGAGPAETAKKLEAVKRQFSIPGQMMASLIVQSVAGFLFTLVIGAFVYTKKKNYKP